MRNTKQAFTLVELIVVITILAILGTIAFISLQGYSADARNSKRTSDIGNIVSKMNIQSTEGVALTSFVTTGNALTIGANVAGTGVVEGTDYQAGPVNTTVLGIKAEDFKDPSSETLYVGGVTTAKGGQFEVAASMENGTGEREAKINGTYKSRTTASGSVTSSTTTTVVLADADINKFFKGDFVTNGAATVKITKVSADLSTLTTSASLSGSTTIALAVAETLGLIESTTAGTPVTDASTTALPY